ncbi:MAG: hypothetical protein VX964_02395 [Verrucomicrobiota bacterium]|nr:hypothetical protein [Verrucomicrobiota bacterium]
MQYLSYILAGIFMVATAVQTVYIHDTNVLLDAKDRRIAALDAAHDAAQSDADFQRVRCDAFYDVVGDYIDVTNQIKALDKAPY